MPDSEYERLRQAAADLAALLPRLEAELPHRPREGFRPPGASGTPGKPGARLASWNTQVAMIILSVHAGVRELEQNLRYRLTGSLRERGGSDGNTLAALDAVVSVAAGSGDRELHHAMRTVERWCWQARLALGETEAWVHVPRAPGQRAARCVYCGFATLRMRALSGLLRCVNPACLDQDGRRPEGRVEYGPGYGEPVVVWNSGDIGVVMDVTPETEGAGT
jgi:hypothetical protein